ncbi:hypothetical protein ASG95_07365 [Phycicoccus sp. Soil803]|nr:hypothetical protein ASG95_07365 [Phycicoccus sp. Soil803]
MERIVAGTFGVAASVAGTFAVFRTTNELGTAALFLVAGAFLLCATFGVVPTRFKVGDNEVTVGRAALQTLEQLVSEGDLPTQEKAIEALEENLARAGITRTSDDAVRAMIARFDRYSGSHLSQALHDELLRSGWSPTTPPKSTYVRWSYDGKLHNVSVYQNSAQLIVNSNRIVDQVVGLPGYEHRTAKNEVIFNYSEGIEPALEAANVLRRYADGELSPDAESP